MLHNQKLFQLLQKPVVLSHQHALKVRVGRNHSQTFSTPLKLLMAAILIAVIEHSGILLDVWKLFGKG